VDKRRKERVQYARCRQSNPDGIDDQGAPEVLKDYSATVARDSHGLDKLVQVVSDQYYVGALTSHVRSGTHRNTDTRLTQRCLCSQHSQCINQRSRYLQLSYPGG